MNNNKKLLWGLSVGASLSIATVVAMSKLRQNLKAMEPSLALKASDIIFEKPSKVLAISPHPDDLDLFAGGTIKLLVEKGFDVTVVDVTNGEKGVNLPNLGSIRQQEQKKAQRILGYNTLKFLHYPDMRINQKRLIRDLRNIWYDVDPEIVFTFDPNFPLKFITHKDHLAVGRATCKLATEMDSDAKLYLYASRKNNVLVDISSTLEDKINCVLCHKSQLRFSSSLYRVLVKKMADLGASGSEVTSAETFRAFHNFDSFPM